MGKSDKKWSKIYKECAIIINECAAQQFGIKTIKELYSKLEEKFSIQESFDDWELPSYDTFRQKLRKHLSLTSRSANVGAALYRFAGAYNKMTIDMLSDNVRISSDSLEQGCRWIIIRLNRCVIEDKHRFNNTQRHLYQLSQALKDKFKNEILFISFDRDTMVILCSSNDAKEKIRKHFDKLNNNVDDSI